MRWIRSALKMFFGGGECFFIDPGLLAYPVEFFRVGYEVFVFDSAGLNEGGKDRGGDIGFEPVACVEVAHSAGGDWVLLEEPWAG